MFVHFSSFCYSVVICSSSSRDRSRLICIIIIKVSSFACVLSPRCSFFTFKFWSSLKNKKKLLFLSTLLNTRRRRRRQRRGIMMHYHKLNENFGFPSRMQNKLAKRRKAKKKSSTLKIWYFYDQFIHGASPILLIILCIYIVYTADSTTMLPERRSEKR